MSEEPGQEKDLDEVLAEPGVEEEDKTGLQLPAKMELFHRGSEIEIVRRWFAWDEVFLTAWAVGIGWLTFVAASKGSLYFLLVGAVEILLVYRAIAGWLNRTYILVSRGKITLRHRPLPWLGNRELEVSDLQQLYTEKVSIRTYARGVTYEVRALTSNDRRMMLVGGLPTQEQASFIERQIEKYLGIKDFYVSDKS